MSCISSPMQLPIARYRKPVCHLVINSNLHPISYCFRVIAAYCSNFGHFAFLSPLWGGLGTTYDVHLELIEKRVVDFLLELIEHFSLAVTAGNTVIPIPVQLST